MRMLPYLFVLSLSLSFGAFAQEPTTAPTTTPTAARGTLVITTTNKKENVSYKDTRVETSSGEVFSCKEMVTVKNSCVLSGVPSGRVKLTASGKKPISRWIDLPEGDNTLRLAHSYRGALIISGAIILATSLALFALDQQTQSDTPGLDGTFAAIGGVYVVGGLFLPAEVVALNGKLVRGKASKVK